MISYVVRPGDTMAAIARRFNTTVDAIMQANNLKDADILFVGQHLRIPAPGGSLGPRDVLPVIRPGNRGLLITVIQQRLQILGYYKKPVDGIYGRGTADAVSAFQRDCGQPITGIVDEATWRALLAKEPCTTGKPCNFATTQINNLLFVLFTNKHTYKPNETIRMTLIKINTDDAEVSLDYATSQRFDFQLLGPDDTLVYQWSTDRNFTQATGTVKLAPGQGVAYAVKTTVPSSPTGTYTVRGWNVARGYADNKLSLGIRIME